MKDHTNSTISKLTNEVKNLSANFERFKSDAEFGKKMNDALVKQLASS